MRRVTWALERPVTFSRYRFITRPVRLPEAVVLEANEGPVHGARSYTWVKSRLQEAGLVKKGRRTESI